MPGKVLSSGFATQIEFFFFYYTLDRQRMKASIVIEYLNFFFKYYCNLANVYSKPIQTSKMELFMKIVNDFQQ